MTNTEGWVFTNPFGGEADNFLKDCIESAIKEQEKISPDVENYVEVVTKAFEVISALLVHSSVNPWISWK